jgi:hypothetical protein
MFGEDGGAGASGEDLPRKVFRAASGDTLRRVDPDAVAESKILVRRADF